VKRYSVGPRPPSEGRHADPPVRGHHHRVAECGHRAPEQDLPDDDEERRDRIAGTEDQVVQEQVHESSHVPDEPGDDIDERHHGRELDRGYLVLSSRPSLKTGTADCDRRPPISITDGLHPTDTDLFVMNALTDLFAENTLLWVLTGSSRTPRPRCGFGTAGPSPTLSASPDLY